MVTKPFFGVPLSGGGNFELVSPFDFATIYNVLPLWNAGIDGTGQTIAIAGRSDINLTDVANFRSAFGLPAKAPTVIVNGSDPGIPSANDKTENTLDVEWSGAVAKGATIKFVITASTSTSDGAFNSALYIIDNKVAPIMSFSYGACELVFGTSGNAAINSLWQQGATQGITIFVASGDQGSAACDCNSVSVGNGNACNFYDTTTDNNAVPCVPGSPNCTLHHTGDAMGVINGYKSTVGYDLATGLGSVNADNLVNNWHLVAASKPTATTGAASSITTTTTTIAGSVNPNGADTHIIFAYGTSSTLSGATKTTSVDLGSGTSAVGVSANLTGLTAGTKYSIR